MTTSVIRLYRSGADYAPTGVAAAPSGDVYAVVGDPGGAGNGVTLVRATMGGTIAWSKQFKPDDDTLGGGGGVAYVASNGSDVAVGYRYNNGANTTLISKYDSTGTLAWRTALPLYSQSDFSMSVSTDGSVYISARGVSGNDSYLTKLNTSTGAVSWSVITRQSSEATTSHWNGPIATLSGNDVVAVVRGAVLGDGFSRARIQRIAATDGGIVWTRTVQWPDQSTHLSTASIVVDGSDNIYVFGPKLDSTSPPENAAYDSFPIIKLDSSGTTSWARIIKPSSIPADTTYAVAYNPLSRGSAGSAGLLFPVSYNVTWDDGMGGGTIDNYGANLFVPAAGTIGGNGQLVQYSKADTTNTPSTYASSTLNSNTALSLFSDVHAANADAFITSSGSTSTDDATWGPHIRITNTWSLIDATSNITVASETFTRASGSGVSASSSPTITTGTSTVLAQTWASGVSAYASGINDTADAFGTPTGQYPAGTATGIPSSNAFTAPRAVFVQYATAVDSTLTFGTGSYRFLVYPTAIAATSAVGSPAVNLNLSYDAASLAVATAFGQPWAEKGMPAGANAADGIANVSALGEPSALATISAAAEGFSTTTLGTPTAVYIQAATGFSTTAFGTPALRTPCNATGISTTAFGTVTVQMFGLATGLSDPTVFGTPSWTRLSSLGSTGLASAAGFGTPDCIENLQHARSHLSRTRFGAPTITRTAP